MVASFVVGVGRAGGHASVVVVAVVAGPAVSVVVHLGQVGAAVSLGKVAA
jgi:hypothetical protein